MDEPELPDRPTAEGRGRCDWKDPGEDTQAEDSLLRAGGGGGDSRSR